VLVLAAVAYNVLQRLVVGRGGADERVAASLEHDWKGKLSPIWYAAGIAASFWRPWLAGAIYVGVAVVWFIPDRRIARVVGEAEAAGRH
jgi:predicted branched-subunit amino acid permease